MLRRLFTCVFVTVLLAANAAAQGTEISYQGQLQSSSSAANGNFDFEFAVFDAVSGGTQLGASVTVNGVVVTNGIFSVRLDFGNQFPGPNRFLEIRVRTAGGGAFSTLSPRQIVNSTPYSIRSLNASTADAANTATTAANISNPLAGDVTGLQSATTVGRLQGRTVSPSLPTNGQVLKFNTATSQWEPANDETGAGGGGGTITGVTAGTGLTGGGTSGSVVLGIINGGVGTAQLADGGVTDGKIVSITGSKVTSAVSNATNAAQLGGVAASQYVVTTDPRMNDARSPTAGSPNYIQNVGVEQPAAQFNIAGSGRVAGTLTGGVLNTNSHINWIGSRVISFPGTENTVAGFLAGHTTTGASNSFFGTAAGSNTSGSSNSFFGNDAGASNTGDNNSFFGRGSGRLSLSNSNSFFGTFSGESNTTGFSNAFFGAFAGRSSMDGRENSFFGTNAGRNNVSGNINSFFGYEAGFSNISGGNNSFFGEQAGMDNTTGAGNSFFGTNAGDTNVGGSSNTLLGSFADVGSGGLTNATAVGSSAQVTASNSLVLGSINGVNFATNSTNVGIGTTAPVARLQVEGGSDATIGGGGFVVVGDTGAGNLVIDNNEIMARNNGATSSLFLNASGGNVGIGVATALDTLHVDGIIRVQTLGAAGATNVCRNGNNQLSTCSSSLRYKTNIGLFDPGMSFVKKLRPISFDWRNGGMKDVGFGAEEIARIDPRFVTYNDKGEVEGVKYDRLSVAFVNAFKEQQQQIETQNATITRQQSEIEALRSLVCAKRRKTGVCKKVN